MANKLTDRIAKDHFKNRVAGWAVRVRVKPSQVRLQRMTRKWASCSNDGRVTFSEDLLTESRLFQDYVIVHELLHLKIRNHGKLFKSLLAIHIPKWKHMLLSCRHSELADRQNESLVRTLAANK